ncbi:hypothetical protein BDQ12DRAFT_678804 [Crucibulum laeve]|uniref:Mitochondrial inner-membrane-bound regulator-domain-containing protein n=1 Tax=Crucibulum laeve TaxID=68775 RepID=A0A5C3M6H8_9AGAR|nr:hypothetical protein BDQ12DRAFT_678804 [Crucibulum laeve]
MPMALQRLGRERFLCLRCLHAISRHCNPSASYLPIFRRRISGSGDASLTSPTRRGPSSGSINTAQKHSRVTRRQSEEENHSNLLEQSKVQKYLNHLASTKNTLTLEDFEKYKPKTHSSPATSNYEVEYNALLDTLVRSFSSQQLRQLIRRYGRNLPAKKTKWNLAVTIIEKQWGWPSLTEIQKQQRDWSEVSYQTFLLDPQQCFLLLGKDGADLLNLSSKYNVHVSLSARPLSLKVEGLRGSLERLSTCITQFKEGIEDEIFTLPSIQVGQDLMQRISRLSGAFIESAGQDKIRIFYHQREAQASITAKRLLAAVSTESNQESPLLIYAPHDAPVSSNPSSLSMFLQTYSLYPFFASQSLPWTSSATSLFRLRRVGEWPESNAMEDVLQTGGLAGSLGSIVALDKASNDLKTRLLDIQHEKHPLSTRTISVSSGHLLWSSPSEKYATLKPPLKGSWQLSKLLDWLQSHSVGHIFSPSPPRPLLTLPADHQYILHRLVYSSLNVSSNKESFKPSNITFEVMLGSKKYSNETILRSVGKGEDTDYSTNQYGNSELSEQNINLEPSCHLSTESKLNLLIPDRPMDLSFSVVDKLGISNVTWPEELKFYYHQLEQFLIGARDDIPQPDTPLVFAHAGVQYALKSNTSVRQSVKCISSDIQNFNAISETIQDTDSNQKTTTCRVLCEDITSDKAWKDFLSRCDWLTTQSSQAAANGTLNNIFSDDVVETSIT